MIILSNYPGQSPRPVARLAATAGRHPQLCLIDLLLLQLCVFVHYAQAKTWLFIDEMWTFNLANNYFDPMIFAMRSQAHLNVWLDSAFWQQILCVQPEHAFAYPSVWYNAAADNHPPLYYAIIHTVCSLFPRQLSVWLGVVPNFIFFMGTQALLFTSARRLTGSQGLALVAVLLYGFSWGAVETATFIRMYMMLSFSVMLVFFLHLRLWERLCAGEPARGSFAALCLAVAFGFLTQYYFVIFLFFLALAFALSLWFLAPGRLAWGKLRTLVLYVVSLAAGLLIALAVFPDFFQQLQHSTRGVEALQNASSFAWSDYMRRLAVFGGFLSRDLAGGHLLWFAAFLALVWGWRRFHKGSQVSLGEGSGAELWLAWAVAGTFLVVAKLASFEVGRYIYMLYPPCCLLGVRLAGAALGRSRAIGGLFAVFLLISSFGMYNHKNLTNTDIYPLLEKIEAEAIRPNPGIACVMIESQKDWVPIMVNAELLRDIPYSYILPYADLQALPQVLREYQAGHDKLLVYAGNYVGAWQSPPGTELTKEEFLKGITELTSYKHWRTLSLRPSGLGSDYELYLFSKEALPQ